LPHSNFKIKPRLSLLRRQTQKELARPLLPGPIKQIRRWRYSTAASIIVSVIAIRRSAFRGFTE